MDEFGLIVLNKRKFMQETGRKHGICPTNYTNRKTLVNLNFIQRNNGRIGTWVSKTGGKVDTKGNNIHMYGIFLS